MNYKYLFSIVFFIINMNIHANYILSGYKTDTISKNIVTNDSVLLDSVSWETDNDSVLIDSISWETDIEQTLNNIVNNDKLSNTTSIGMQVWDLTNDKPIFNYNEKTRLRPASTMKCITSIAALDKLGSDYKFHTSIYYSGTLVDSVNTLYGDIYCVGGMDPLLTNNTINEIVDSIKALGINLITGNIYADLSFKDKKDFGRGWCWDDKNPCLSPLQINCKDDFVSVLYQKLLDNNIKIDGTPCEKQLPTNATLIIDITHPLSKVMIPMMKYSNNYYAESIFYQLAAISKRPFATAVKARKEIYHLIRKLELNPKDYNIADGSGLSLYNYLTPELEVRFLRYAYNNLHIYQYLLPTLPIAAKDGTLRKRLRNTPAAYKIYAKTGTLFGVSSLAGYAMASNGRQLCFSIIINGSINNQIMKNFQDKICIALCE